MRRGRASPSRGSRAAGCDEASDQTAEAERRKRVTRFVRDVFTRLWTQSVPEGWPAAEMDDDSRFKVAEALGSWIAYTPETHKERARKVSDALFATPPPPGWRPCGPDDELLRTLLPDEAV
ncbi:NUDIX hydrolase [Archangium minus]|uniref:NUDIX hydrolase n=1 Tax=Archangium minus TaxID=83450 RepID=UPI0037C1390C